MEPLARRHCEACDAGTPRLDEAAALELRPQLHESWELQPDRLRRSVRTRDFAEAFALATRVALLAEQEGHHPDLSVGWGHLDIELTTHAIKGLSLNDFVMAARIDQFL